MRLPRLVRTFLLLTLLGVFCLPLAAGATTHNLAAEWSDTANPHGLWSYNVGDIPLSSRGYWGEIGGGVWGSPTYFLPVAFKITVDRPSGYDLLTNDTGVHGDYTTPTNLTWTSDLEGWARVRGNAWLVRNIGRNMYWGIYADGVLKTSGLLTAGTYSRAAPFDFQNGSGGPEALAFRVAPGTKVSLSLWVAPGAVPDYVGVNFTIDAVPYPGTMLLLLD
jgi:hypothetical protein